MHTDRDGQKSFQADSKSCKVNRLWYAVPRRFSQRAGADRRFPASWRSLRRVRFSPGQDDVLNNNDPGRREPPLGINSLQRKYGPLGTAGIKRFHRVCQVIHRSAVRGLPGMTETRSRQRTGGTHTCTGGRTSPLDHALTAGLQTVLRRMLPARPSRRTRSRREGWRRSRPGRRVCARACSWPGSAGRRSRHGETCGPSRAATADRV